LHSLGVNSGRAQQLQDRWLRLRQARLALAREGNNTNTNSSSDDTGHAGLRTLLEECVDLREVWVLLGGVWSQLKAIGAQR
jgi:hypothetical protein